MGLRANSAGGPQPAKWRLLGVKTSVAAQWTGQTGGRGLIQEKTAEKPWKGALAENGSCN